MISRILAGRGNRFCIATPMKVGQTSPSRIFDLSGRLNLSQVKAVIFDIDGTLYSLGSSPFVKRYMELIKTHLQPDAYAAFQTEWHRALAGKSAFRSGRIYDETQKKVVVPGDQGKVVQAFEPWGGELSREEVARLYPDTIHKDDKGFTFMEGGTWVLTGLARSFGIGYEENETIYQQIYGEILQDPQRYFRFQSPHLSRFFSQLKARGCKIVVMSNTPSPMAPTIVKALGALGSVDLFISDARKPEESRAHLRRILQTFHLKPNQVLAVGDSAGNDLAVPHQMGIQTFLVEDFPVQTEKDADAKGKNIQSLIEAFRQIWKEKAA